MARQEPYDTTRTYKARRYFTLHGVKYHPGDVVPRGLVAEATYRRWFEKGTIRIDYDTDALHAASRSPQTAEATVQSIPSGEDGKASVQRAVQSTVESIGGASSEPPLTDGYRHIGRGWYEVAHGENRQKVRTEPAAAALYASWRGDVAPAVEDPAPIPEGNGSEALALLEDSLAPKTGMSISAGDQEEEDGEDGPAVDGHGNEIE
jgi:hypothetical protein